MLEFIREYLPISGAEWDLVTKHHSTFHPECERTADQLKKKFNKMARTKVPMVEPNIPLSFQDAKAIRFLITEKADGATWRMKVLLQRMACKMIMKITMLTMKAAVIMKKVWKETKKEVVEILFLEETRKEVMETW